MLIHPDRLFPAEPGARKIARTLYDHVRTLPIVSPHGHVQAAWFAANEPFPDPAQLLVQPDHYITRMLYSQGVSLEDLEHSIGLTEVNYGHIVDAFQIAYAIGLLGAGQLIDKLGTRIGYMLVMAVWSLSAMGHALASAALEFGFARFFLGLGEAGNFPAAIKTVAEWFPQSERSLATGIFNLGANVGAILAPLIVPWVTLRYGWHVAFLTTGLFSALWILYWFRRYRRPADHPSLTGEELRHIYQEASTEMGPSPSVPWRGLAPSSQDTSCN